MTRRAYIAAYPTPENEVVLHRDTYWTTVLSASWDKLEAEWKPGDPRLQAWYADDYNTQLLAQIG